MRSNENDNVEDEDVREMAQFLLSEYFDQPTVVSNEEPVTPNTTKPSPLVIPDTIQEQSVSANRTSQTDVDDEFYSERSMTYSGDQNYASNADEEDEKKMTMDTPSSYIAPLKIDRQKEEISIPTKINSKKDKKHVSRRKKINKKRKYKQRKGGKSPHLNHGTTGVIDGGNMSDDVVVLDPQRTTPKTATPISHKYSPRPLYGAGYPNTNPVGNGGHNHNNLSPVDNDDVLNISLRRQISPLSALSGLSGEDTKEEEEDNIPCRTKEQRIEIRNKFRRGVRKAMLVNAWTGITAQTDNNPDGNAKAIIINFIE